MSNSHYENLLNQIKSECEEFIAEISKRFENKHAANREKAIGDFKNRIHEEITTAWTTYETELRNLDNVAGLIRATEEARIQRKLERSIESLKNQLAVFRRAMSH